ncbi:golgin subfamily A member 6-like protein 2 [Abrus precatorius]|uniref:Golgin subfamily A member 6-like protein 2 n=1 Tax=Abrus precatorius TaxID=3816 RepID=A0A8B8K2Q0_ABRPR|nr:golgin subfamily A member 6-like protein 2 [Abrus precatorius]
MDDGFGKDIPEFGRVKGRRKKSFAKKVNENVKVEEVDVALHQPYKVNSTPDRDLPSALQSDGQSKRMVAIGGGVGGGDAAIEGEDVDVGGDDGAIGGGDEVVGSRDDDDDDDDVRTTAVEGGDVDVGGDNGAVGGEDEVVGSGDDDDDDDDVGTTAAVEKPGGEKKKSVLERDSDYSTKG